MEPHSWLVLLLGLSALCDVATCTTMHGAHAASLSHITGRSPSGDGTVLQIIADAEAAPFVDEPPFKTGKLWLLQEMRLVIACSSCRRSYAAGVPFSLSLENIVRGSSCDARDVSLVAIFTGPTWSARVATPAASGCAWELGPFTLSLPGTYRLEIRLVNWKGLAPWKHIARCDALLTGVVPDNATVLATTDSIYVDTCACNLWCLRTINCTASLWIPQGRHCTLYSRETPSMVSYSGESFFALNRITNEERKQLPTFLGDLMPILRISTLASAGNLVWGSGDVSVTGAFPATPPRPQCTEVKPSHNIWTRSICDNSGFPQVSASDGYCRRGLAFSEGMGRCHIASYSSELLYIEPAECQYVYYTPSQFSACLAARNITNVTFDGDSIIEFLRYEMTEYIWNLNSTVRESSNSVQINSQFVVADGIFVGNSNIVHFLWHGGELHELEDAWKRDYLPRLKSVTARFKFFLLPPPMMSEREPHCILDRAVWLSEIIRRQLVPLGFHVLPWTNITLPVIRNYSCGRDSMHASPQILRMLITMMANVICGAAPPVVVPTSPASSGVVVEAIVAAGFFVLLATVLVMVFMHWREARNNEPPREDLELFSHADSALL